MFFTLGLNVATDDDDDDVDHVDGDDDNNGDGDGDRDDNGSKANEVDDVGSALGLLTRRRFEPASTVNDVLLAVVWCDLPTVETPSKSIKV